MYIYPKNQDNSLIRLFSNQIKEAENVLKYTLQIPVDDIEVSELPDKLDNYTENAPKDLSTLTDFFDKICESIYEKCNYLFNRNDPNIFGYKAFDIDNLSTKYNFWKYIFRQDMILSAFIKLRKLIGISIPVKSYTFTQFANYTIDDSNLKDNINKTLHGLDYLTGCSGKKYMEIINNDNNCILLKKMTPPSCTSVDLSAYGQNMKKHLDNSLKNLKCFNINNLFFESYDTKQDFLNKNLFLFLNVMEFSQITLSQKKNSSNPNSISIYPIINSHIKEKAFHYSDYHKYINCIHYLHTQSKIEALDRNINVKSKDNSPEHKLSLSDKIYLRYQIEKIFAPMMIDCMYHNINLTAHTHLALDDQATINRLSSCFTLPNVFTRHYIFQLAVDTLRNHNEDGFDDSYFFSKYLKHPTAVVTKVREKFDYLRSYKASAIWQERYESFINYLGHMLLPIYENLFFIKVWNYIRTIYPNNNDAQCIVLFYKLLRQYLNNEDCVQELFSTEKTFCGFENDIKQGNSKIKVEHILKPSFIPDEDINTDLYHKCILSQNITIKQKNTPEFLSLKYINQYVEDPTERIQSLYICSFMS